jgi:hypothetical protein
MKQLENEILRDPLIKHMTLKGWFCKILHSDELQEGFTDFQAYKDGMFRPIECKIIRRNSISFTKAQLRDFEEFVKHGQDIWIVCLRPERDLSEKTNLIYLDAIYQKILNPIGQGRDFLRGKLNGNYRTLY